MRQTTPRLRANFDVGVLFYNRVGQTIDCVLSFLNEDIQPDIVVLDQGSAATQRELLNETLGAYPNVRVVSLSENIGVAAARNQLCRECSSAWILFVDNDVTLNTRSGVTLISSAVANADGIDGFCPRIMNVHENRFVDRLQFAGQHGRLEVVPASSDSATLNMFAGGAVILRRSMLLGMPFDERYFVGFEDFDLALRAYIADRPLQLQCLNEVVVVHKHMPVISDPDIASTRTRYNIPLISKGFDVLKTKYHGEVFDHWDAWVANQQKQMIATRLIVPRIPRDRINVTFVVDIPNCALDNAVKNLALGDDHALTVVYAQHDDDIGQTLQRLVESDPHVVHFMQRTDVRRIVCVAAVKQCAVLMGLSETEIVDRLCQSHITFSVCDHIFLSEKDIVSWRPLYWLSDGYLVNSPTLFDIYSGISSYPKPAAIISNGEDRVPQWRSFFADALRRAHMDAPNWRQFMIETFFLVVNPRQ